MLDKEKNVKRIEEYLDILVCPGCRRDLKIGDKNVVCTSCGIQYNIKDGIPLFFRPNDWGSSKKDVTDEIKFFYEKTPFPNYEDFENIGDLVQKAGRGVFASLLNEQIPFNVRVLEVGCGTGQLSNFLGIAQRFVFGTDMCFNSLGLAESFRGENNLNRVHFC